jgi:hypothetical protein
MSHMSRCGWSRDGRWGIGGGLCSMRSPFIGASISNRGQELRHLAGSSAVLGSFVTLEVTHRLLRCIRAVAVTRRVVRPSQDSIIGR